MALTWTVDHERRLSVATASGALSADGALALVASSDAEREVGAYFARRTNSERPCRIFSSVDAAHAWFAELDAASRD